MTTKRKLAYSALLINALVWGASFPIIKPIFAYLSPLQFLYFRFLVAGICAIPIFLHYYLKIRPKISYLIKVLSLELLSTSLLPLLYLGLSKTSALEASLIGSTGPIFVILAGTYLLHEHETKREWQGLVISVIGSFALIFEPIWNGHGLVGSSLSGNLYVFLFNIFNVIYLISAKRMYRTKPPMYLGSLTYLFTALIFGIVLSTNNSLPSFQLLALSQVLIPVLYMAIPGSILAFALYLYAASKIEVSEATLFTYLNGMVAIPAAFFFLGEVPSTTTIIAILVIAYGVYRAETRSSH